VHPFGEQLHYVDAKPSADPARLAAFLHGKGFDDVIIERIRPTVEDCFMRLMQ